MGNPRVYVVHRHRVPDRGGDHSGVEMRSVWVDEGNDADYVTCKRNGCDTLSFAIRDPRTPNNLKTA